MLLRRVLRGGVFTALTDIFLNNSNAIICAVYDYELKRTVYKFVTTTVERDAARGSKYMYSIPGDIFKKAYEWLMENPEKELLFIGLGCQAEGLRKFAELKNIRERVYIVDLICHGAVSPLIWSQYAEKLEKHYKGKIDYLTFRKKETDGTKKAYVTIDGREISIKKYMNIYGSRCANRPSCHMCPFTTIKREVDITMGDFWHLEEKMPQFYDPAGNSLVIIHTIRGLEIFEKIKKTIEYRESNTTDCMQFNLKYPTPASGKRSDFWKDFEKKGIGYIVKKYGTIPIYVKVKRKAQNYLGKVFNGGRV